MYVFCRWCSLDWKVDGGIEWHVGDNICYVISGKGEVILP